MVTVIQRIIFSGCVLLLVFATLTIKDLHAQAGGLGDNLEDTFADLETALAELETLNLDELITDSVNIIVANAILSSANASGPLAPTFFKKRLSPDWRRVTAYPYDNQAKKPFRDRLHFVINPLDVPFVSYAISGEITREGIFLPQITLSFAHSFSYALPYASIDEELSSLNDFKIQTLSPTLLLSKSVSHHLKFFGGYRFVAVNMTYPEPLRTLLADELVDGIGDAGDVVLSDGVTLSESIETAILENRSLTQYYNFIVLGFANLSLNNNWHNAVYAGIDPFANQVYYNMEFANRVVALGFTITPSTFLSFRTYLKIQISI